MIKQKAIFWFFWPFIALFEIFSTVQDFNYFITSNLAMLNILLFALLFIIYLTDFSDYLAWKSKNKKRVESGQRIEYINSKIANNLMKFQIGVPLFFLNHPILCSKIG